MKRLVLFFLILFKLTSAFAQADTSLFLNSNSIYYDSTNLSRIDSLDSWFYVLMDKNPSYKDPIKPIGQLILQRKHMIKGLTPNFTFQIFSIKDSAYCFKKSQSVRTLSSCVPPNVAGDIIIVNQYIFLNTNICLRCKSSEDGLDYCRPVINKIFSAVDTTKVASLEDMVVQFPIQGQIMKLPF